MDSDDSFNPDDHGLNMDPAPASHDDPRTNLDTVPANFEDPGAHTGPSTSRPVTTAKGPIRCVNCGLNVTRIRRHLLEIAEVRNLIQQWVQQQVEVSRESFVCHSCWTAAWSQIRNPTQQQNAPPARHGQVCISCGRSIVRQRSHSLMSDSPRVEVIRNVIACHIGTNEMPSSSRVCQNCWRRTNRAVLQSNEETESSRSPSLQPEVTDAAIEADRQEQIEADYQGQQALNTPGAVLLPNYVRAPNTQSHCFFPGCNSSNRLTVPSALRVQLFCEYNYYVPPDCRICHYHLYSNSWHMILEATYNPIKTFSVAQIEEFASLLKDNMFNHLDFENIQNMPEHTVHYYLGVSKAQFQEILFEVPRLRNKHRGSFALAAYLMKLRTGDSDERMSALLQVPRSTLERHMNMAREILNQDFVPRHLGLNNITRRQIAERNLLIPNGLFGGEDRSPIIIADGTYVYIEKSSNYLFQKRTYSNHKYRNLIKPFLFVCSDGYIIEVLGPYAAKTSDADIINKEFSDEHSPLRQYFQAGDVFILDRGFRDSLPLLQQCGYQVHVPLSAEAGEQLSTRDANKSRAVTMCRWVVEAVNGIFKTSFKIFRQNYFNRASTHVMSDFSVAAALINKFHMRIRDRDDAAQILDEVRRNMETHNDLSDYVVQRNLNRSRADFRNINVDSQNVREFPTLTYNELVLIACGTYQIKQARSYYGEHIRFNGSYKIEVCSDHRSSIMEGMNISQNCSLIRARIASRHIGRKIYFVYILINSSESGRNAIKKYCCNCIAGRRTVGCCAHIMTVIWYLGWARHQSNIFAPAEFLDNVLIIYDTIHDDAEHHN